MDEIAYLTYNHEMTAKSAGAEIVRRSFRLFSDCREIRTGNLPEQTKTEAGERGNGGIVIDHMMKMSYNFLIVKEI